MVGLVGGEPLFTRGFRRLLDVVFSLLGAGVALGAPLDGDAVFSAALALAGIAGGVNPVLAAAGSVPVGLLAQAMPVEQARLAAALLRLLRAGATVYLVAREAGRLGQILDRALIQAGLLAAVTLLGGGVALYLVEGGVEGSGVSSIWDALWLALVTMTTVGYGDIVPSTPHGKLVAVLVMLVGIGIFTFFLSSLAVGLSRVVLLGEDNVSPYEKKKRVLAEMVRNLESLSEEELDALINDLRFLHLLATADKRDMIRIDLSPESLGVAAPDQGEAAA